MILVALRSKNYKKFSEGFWDFFQDLPNCMDFWERFTFTNPFTFYGIFNKKEGEQGDTLDNLVVTLKKYKCKKDKLDEHYATVRHIQKHYEKIKSK